MSVMSMVSMMLSMLFVPLELVKRALMRELILCKCGSLLDVMMMAHVHLSLSHMRSNWNFVVVFFMERMENQRLTDHRVVRGFVVGCFVMRLWRFLMRSCLVFNCTVNELVKSWSLEFFDHFFHVWMRDVMNWCVSFWLE